MLKGQDIVILIKILSKMSSNPKGDTPLFAQNALALHLCMSTSEVHTGITRLIQANLLGEIYKEALPRKKIILPNLSACEEFLIFSVKYFFSTKLGAYTRGIITSYAAPAFENKIVVGESPIPVWPYAEGKERGLTLEPLYRSVPQSVMEHPDPEFYEYLTIVDAIRAGRPREREIAIKLLKEKLDYEQE
jgi:hypothetical protein